MPPRQAKAPQQADFDKYGFNPQHLMQPIRTEPEPKPKQILKSQSKQVPKSQRAPHGLVLPNPHSNAHAYKESAQLKQDPSFKSLQHDINKIGYSLKEMAATRPKNEFTVNHRRQ